jgi:hypothetical protein
MTKLLDIKPSPREDKKLVATFCHCKGETKCCDKDRTKVHFGAKSSSTYLDHKDETKRKAYIARHKVNEDFNKPMTAGALAKHILWGATTSLRENIKLFKKRFNL